MFFDRSALGAAALVGSRNKLGITQEQLAERAGMSVRAIRDLEAGRVGRPRRTSLALLSSALDLTADEATWFLASWFEEHSGGPIVELLIHGCDLETLLAVQSRLGFRDVALWESVLIGPDRRMVSRHVSTVIEAEQDDLTHRLVLYGNNDHESFDRSHVQVIGGTGCRTSTQVLNQEPGLAAYDLTFTRPLSRGDTHMLSYEIAVAPAARSGRPLIEADDALRACHRPVTTMALRVQFDGCEIPQRAWEVCQIGGRLERRERQLQFDDSGVDLVLRNLAPGVYGIRWSW